jgi:hypothetical protein
MNEEQRQQLVSEVITRSINCAPVNEVIRVYSLSLQNAIEAMDDTELLEAVLKAGFTDILEKYVYLEDLISDDEGTSEESDSDE